MARDVRRTFLLPWSDRWTVLIPEMTEGESVGLSTRSTRRTPSSRRLPKAASAVTTGAEVRATVDSQKR